MNLNWNPTLNLVLDKNRGSQVNLKVDGGVAVQVQVQDKVKVNAL